MEDSPCKHSNILSHNFQAEIIGLRRCPLDAVSEAAPETVFVWDYVDAEGLNDSERPGIIEVRSNCLQL